MAQQKWEYEEVAIPYENTPYGLNEWGDKGWEVCGTLMEIAGIVTFLVKRPKEE